MIRRLLVGLFVVLLVAQPAAASSYISAGEACGTADIDGETLVGIFPGESDGVTDNRTLYAGTTFRVALCDGNGELKPTRGSEWSLSESPGLEVLERTDETATVRVTGERNVDVPGLVADKSDLDGVGVTVPAGTTVESKLADGTVRFANATAARKYAEQERRYLAAVSNLSEAVDRLNESSAPPEETDLDATLVEINASADTVAAEREGLEKQLYNTAWDASDPDALAAISEARDRERATRADAEDALDGYLARLEAAESDARTTVLLNFGGAALVGLIVGVLPGWKLTASKLADIRYDRQVNSNVSYGPRVLARAGGLALVALGLTLAALVALGGLDAFGGLL